MKAFKHTLLKCLVVGLCAAAVYACSPEYMTYDVNLKDGIYFGNDSISFQFGLTQGESYTYDLSVGVMGFPQDRERSFSVEVVAEGTTAQEGLHYNLPSSFSVKAGAVAAGVPVTLLRYRDPELSQHPFTLTLRLKENDNFRVVMNQTLTLEFTDEELAKPYWWQDTFFGPYSQMLMIDILQAFWAMEETHNALYNRMVSGYGHEFEGGTIGMGFPYQFRTAFVKYVITPVYEYYQEHPHEKVSMPNPETLY